MTDAETPTLYDWAGGSEPFRRMIEAFYDRVEADALLSPLFPGGVSEHHRAHVAVWWIEVFGGSADYTAQLGGYERMLAQHNSQPDAQVAPHAPVPRWGWGVAPPWQG